MRKRKNRCEGRYDSRLTRKGTVPMTLKKQGPHKNSGKTNRHEPQSEENSDRQTCTASQSKRCTQRASKPTTEQGQSNHSRLLPRQDPMASKPSTRQSKTCDHKCKGNQEHTQQPGGAVNARPKRGPPKKCTRAAKETGRGPGHNMRSDSEEANHAAAERHCLQERVPETGP